MSNHLEKSLETLAVEDGITRFKKDLAAKQANGILNHSQSKLFTKTFLEASQYIEDMVNSTSKGGPVQKWRETIKGLSVDQLTWIGLNSIFSAIVLPAMRAGVYNRIGSQVLATLKMWEDTPENTNLLYDIGAQVYHRLIPLPIFEEYTDSKQAIFPNFSDVALAELHEVDEWESFMSPFWRPMVSKPRSVLEGSYLDSKLSNRLTLVRTFSKHQKSLLEALMKPETPFVKACDAIQEVPLKINQWMLPIIKQSYKEGLAIGSVPINILPKGSSAPKRLLRSQLKSLQASFLADLDEAQHYSAYDEVYLPVTMDFRGRVYAKPYLNHQRADYIKSMWLFVEGKALDTPEAVNWLKIHIANTGDFDKVSKKSFEDRVAWVNTNFVRIYDAVQDPFQDRWWTTADSPFSFLAACRELVNFVDVGADYICHLPVAIDGSCSGLQHYSAMLRDEVGAKSVNLVPNNKPEDVYKDVANIVNQLVIQDTEDPIAQEWLNHKIDRKVTKRATMTLCYGSKQYGWREQLMEDFMNKYTAQISLGKLDKHPFESSTKASSYMAKQLDVALRMTVTKALEGMEWLQGVAGLLAKENKHIEWLTPLQFPVVNEYFTPIEKRFNIVINKKSVRTKLRLGFSDKLKVTKQKTTVAPNFVHSYDASHLMMTVLAAKEEDINSFLLIHDSFGCLPSDMQRFSQVVKEQFVNLYIHNDPFMSIYTYSMSHLSEKGKEKLTPPPTKGTLNINSILKSNFAFA